MRRFSSEGNLLGMDLLSWKRDNPPDEIKELDTHGEDEMDTGASSLPSTPIICVNAGTRPGKELRKEVSMSVENLSDLDKSSGLLKVTSLNDSFKAYSDSQLAGGTNSSTESMEKDEVPSPPSKSSPTLNPFCFNAGTHHHRDQVKAKLSSAKLHLKSLFGQSPNSSNSNLTTPSPPPENRETSAKEKRSRFVKQWSEVGHAKTRLSKAEMEKWAESLDAVLDSRVGVSVFQAFLRSEFSEENLQFYQACEQYRHSSTTFTLQRRAKEIGATYIQEGAQREVNLDSKTRELTLQLLKAPSHNSLCHAQKRIRSLLEFDCYPRFLQSNVYLKLLEDAH
ncbi:regulator of G-protein signaling rgs-7 [Trichomycterus rosablanca]|uniref:regulator of G-protein signaling rgs-7 n=1 Tax=Trichomycterus rosablanca TaxID=2290929 RepID=UPI002F356B2E